LNLPDQPRLRGGKPPEWIVQLDDFEGPLDKLLRLVEKQEIDISSVPVYAVILQLVAFLEADSYDDIDTGGRFLVLASNLLAIKAHLLSPDREIAAGAEGGYWNGDEIDGGLAVTAEAEYLLFRDAARNLEDCARDWIRSYKRQPLQSAAEQPDRPDLRDDVARLVTAFKEILVRVDFEPVPYQVETAVDFDQKMDLVFGKIAGNGGRLPFHRLFENASRLEGVYSFLAVLELVFRGRLRLSQQQDTNEIILVAVNENVKAE
jgi:segregation and condensation protein A